MEISADFIAEEYVETTPEPSATPSRNRDDDEPTPAPEPYYEPVKEKDLITYTEDGTGIFFMDNANLNENKGSLNFSKSGEKKSTVKIADDVYYNIAAAKDGSGAVSYTHLSIGCFCSSGVNIDMAVSSAHVICRTTFSQ